MAKHLIGLTGPSAFTQECIDMIEEFLDCDFVMLYHNKENTLRRWVDRCDGIILAGGGDMHPSCYDESVWNNSGFTAFDIRRDEREFQIIHQCFTTGKPLLGICRGHQELAVALGFQIIPDLGGSIVCHQPQRQQIKIEKREPMHSIRLVEPEKYFKVFSGSNPPERATFHKILAQKWNEHLWVNSFHHQGVVFPGKRNIPEGVTVHGVGFVGMQSLKEIIELMSGPTWLSCQFHPEYDWQVNSASRAVLERFKNMLQKK